MDEHNNILPNETSDVYEKANEAATKPSSAFTLDTDSTAAASSNNHSAFGNSTANHSTPAFNSSNNNSGYVVPSSYDTSSSSYTSSNNTSSYYSSQEPQQFSTGFAIASLILGILSILTTCCCGIGILFGIVGIILGCLQQKDMNENKPGMAVAGIATSSVGIVLSILFLFITILGSYV